MIRICLPVNYNICISVVIVVPETKLMISAVVTLNVAAAALAIGAGVNPVPPVIAAGLACLLDLKRHSFNNTTHGNSIFFQGC
jgi:hypothetical protein